jgi:hypothetical protein
MMGYSRDRFLSLQGALRRRRRVGAAALTRRKPILKNRTPLEVEAIIVELSLDRPAYGQIRIANELRKLGHSISPARVRGAWQ